MDHLIERLRQWGCPGDLEELSTTEALENLQAARQWYRDHKDDKAVVEFSKRYIDEITHFGDFPLSTTEPWSEHLEQREIRHGVLENFFVWPHIGVSEATLNRQREEARRQRECDLECYERDRSRRETRAAADAAWRGFSTAERIGIRRAQGKLTQYLLGRLDTRRRGVITLLRSLVTDDEWAEVVSASPGVVDRLYREVIGG